VSFDDNFFVDKCLLLCYTDTRNKERGEQEKMKKFVYDVAGFEFEDSAAFGKAWREAKALAAEKHSAIYRKVIEGEQVSNEVFTSAGFFLSTKFAKAEDVAIF
jgi:hypothetical protein